MLFFLVNTFKFAAIFYHVLSYIVLMCLTTCTSFTRLLLTDVIQCRGKGTRSESRTLYNEYFALIRVYIYIIIIILSTKTSWSTDEKAKLGNGSL